MATSNQNPGTLAAGRSRATGTVASVTVVYNAAVVLSRHLQSLKSQSRKLDEIVVVDNASTDGTRGLLAKEYPDVTVLSLPENCGVGGGLAAGLEYAALQKKHDWVWIFDQDGVPERDSLARLLGGLLYLNGSEATTAVLAPVCVHPETGMICHGLSWRGGRLLPTSIAKDEPITFLDSVISSGSLVRRDAIEKVGLPRADFYMDFVDHEHCLRLRRSGFKIAVVRDSRMAHALGEPSKQRFLGKTKHWSDHEPWREYYVTRNEIYTIWRYYSDPVTKALVLYRMMRRATGILLFGKHKKSCLQMMLQGMIDGRAGRPGKKHLPGAAN